MKTLQLWIFLEVEGLGVDVVVVEETMEAACWTRPKKASQERKPSWLELVL